MSEPTVCCVMLVNGRPEMVRRAVASFRSQTYERKRLLIVNTGPGPALSRETDLDEWPQEQEPCFIGADAKTIGALRNMGNKFAAHHYVRSSECVEVFAHFDSDDWSHPNRLTEQVALLQASGADCVGYNQAVFWDETCRCGGDTPGPRLDVVCPKHDKGRAWVYTSMVPKGILGASMLYWRAAWERKPFLDRMTGEDDRWLSGMKVCGVSGLFEPTDEGPSRREPRLIAGVHGGNTSRVNPCEGPREWRRAPELDAYCGEKMQL